MLMVLWDIGCRNTELRTLKLGNMYSNDFTIKIEGKRKKERIVPMD